jgi:hypothetical protein
VPRITALPAEIFLRNNIRVIDVLRKFRSDDPPSKDSTSVLREGAHDVKFNPIHLHPAGAFTSPMYA